MKHNIMERLFICIFIFTMYFTSSFTLSNRNNLLGNWDNDVYSGRQWNEYLTPTKVASPIVHTPAVLLLYTPECMNDIMKIGLSDWSRPPLQYMVFAKYDCETTPQYIWYNLDEKDLLCERYDYEHLKCGSFLYFANGSDINTPTDIFDEHTYDWTVNQWMWGKIKVEFSVYNTLTEPVIVYVHGRGPKVPSRVIDPLEKLTFSAFQSYMVLVQSKANGTFYHGSVLDLAWEQRMIVIEAKAAMGDQKSARKWYKQRDSEIQKASLYMRSWRWGVAEIYLMNFKQSPLLPKFTELGYKKGTIPADLYKNILNWYKENLHRRTPEESKVEPAINDSEVKCTMVFLTPDMVEYIGDVMKPYLEEWSNVSLVQTRLYGIREYYHGNILRDHVDRITTHIISVILQIDKELDGAADWALEVIGFDGMRKNVTLEPGEMLFYESSTLIHGRPFPFQGRMFANAFLHYKPKDHWPWDLSGDGLYILKEGERIEPTRAFATPNTYKYGTSREKDEL